MTISERGLWIDDPRDREDLATLPRPCSAVGRCCGGAAAESAPGGRSAATGDWRRRAAARHTPPPVATGLEVLASRVVAGRVRPGPDRGADALVAGLPTRRRRYADPGFPMDSAWRGGLPPEGGFVHLDDIPARLMLDLAQQRRCTGSRARQCPRAAGLTARPGGNRGQCRRIQRRHPRCAASSRVDGDGVSAADRR